MKGFAEKLSQCERYVRFLRRRDYVIAMHAYKLFIAGLSTSSEPDQTRYAVFQDEKNGYDLTADATAKETRLNY